MDTILSPVGIQQAQDIGDSLSHLHVDSIICSDLKRASQTAEHIQAKLSPKPPLKSSKLMRERNFGIHNGEPRSLIHEFIAFTKGHKNGCAMWRNNKGECGHQVFWRAMDFFFELCEMVNKRAGQEKPVFPPLGGNAEKERSEPPVPLFLPVQQPYMPDSLPTAHRPPQLTDEDDDTPITNGGVANMKYGGHFVLVGHGQWIREFISILAKFGTRTLGFPSTTNLMPVLSNCQLCQFGISFYPSRLASYARLLRQTVTASLYSACDRNLRLEDCGYNLKTKEHMPLYTVCYHTRLGVETVHMGRLLAEAIDTEVKAKEAKEADRASKEPLTAGTGVETLYFLNEDDEYAGLPMPAN